MRLLIITLMTLSSVLSNEEELKCIVGYLRANGINEDLLSSVENPWNEVYCDLIVNNTMESIFQRAGLYKSENLEGDKPKAIECMKRDTEYSGVKKLGFLVVALEKYEPGWKVWQHYSLSNRKTKLIEALNLSIGNLLKKCNEELVKHRIGAAFDKVIYKRNDNYRGEDEYCLRKHLVDKQILSGHNYNLNINPKGVKENESECSLLITAMINSFYSSWKYPQCEEEEYRKKYVGEHYLKIEFVLPNLYLTPVEIAREKKDFIEYIYTITLDAKAFCKDRNLNQ